MNLPRSAMAAAIATIAICPVLLSAQQGSLRPDTIPFELLRNQVVLRVPFADRDTLNMILDTGVTPSGIDLAFAREAGLLESDEPIGNAGGAGSESFPLYGARMEGGRVGSIRLDSVPAVAMDHAMLSNRLGRPFGGALGHAFLEGRKVRIDYPRRLVILEPDGPPEGEILFSDSLVLVPNDIIPLVHVTVNGVRIPVSLDTGSSLTLELFPRAAEAASIEAEAGSEQRLTGARGDFVSGTGRAGTIAFGSAIATDRSVTLSEARGGDARWGNLGNGFLQEFVLTLDYRGRSLTLSRSTGSSNGRGGTDRPDTSTVMFAGGPARGGVLRTEGVARPGRLRWELATGGPVRSSPIVADGTVFVGSHDHFLYAVDLESGATRWRFEADRPIASAPAVDADAAYVTDENGTLYAVGRRDGGLRWRVDVGPALAWAWGLEGWDYVGSSVALSEDVVVAGAADGVVRGVDRATGHTRWRVATGGRVRSSPAIADGRVFVGSADGFVYCLDLATGEERWRFETRGATLESADFGFDRRTISGGPAVAGGVVYVGSRDARIYALDADTGRELWSDDDGSSAWVISTPAVAGGLVVFGRSSSSKVQALDGATGDLRWEVEVGGGVYASPAVVDEVVYVSTGGTAALWALDLSSGAVRWRRPLGAPSWSSPTVSGGVVVSAADDGLVRAIEATEGEPPRTAVYFDAALGGDGMLGRRGADAAIVEHLEARGFEVVDAGALAGFLDRRIVDRAPSVVVMATDVLPPGVATLAADGGLLRRYLGAGGKVVWVGPPPFMIMPDPESGRLTMDISRPTRFLGVDHGAFVTDSRVHRPTSEGEAWGLSGWWMGPGGILPTEVSTVLATDGEGRASAWVRSFGGPGWAGWVSLPYRAGEDWLEALARVAETGVMRPPAEASPPTSQGRRPPESTR